MEIFWHSTVHSKKIQLSFFVAVGHLDLHRPWLNNNMSHKWRMLSVFLPAQLREKLQVESLAEGRSCVIRGCSMQDTSSLRKNIELLVDALLLNISWTQTFYVFTNLQYSGQLSLIYIIPESAVLCRPSCSSSYLQKLQNYISEGSVSHINCGTFDFTFI